MISCCSSFISNFSLLLRFLDMLNFCMRRLPNFPNLSISVNLHKVELLHSSSYWTITFHFDQTIPIWPCKLTPQVHFVWFYIDCVLIMKLHFRLCSLPFYSEWLYWLLAESKGNLPSEKRTLHTLSPAVSLYMKDWTQNPNTFEVIKYHLLVKDVFAE